MYYATCRRSNAGHPARNVIVLEREDLNRGEGPDAETIIREARRQHAIFLNHKGERIIRIVFPNKLKEVQLFTEEGFRLFMGTIRKVGYTLE